MCAKANTDKDNAAARNTAVIDSRELASIREQIMANKANKSKVSVIAPSDLERIRKEVVIKDKTTLEQERRMMNEQKEQSMAEAKARKTRMQTQDRERAAQKPLVASVQQNTFGANSLLMKAQQQIDENYDDVKAMNTLALQSKVLTIREKQLEENKRLENDWLEEQRRLDMMMEIERLKALQAEHEREEAAKAARIAASQVLIDQIASRQEARNKELEMLEKEKAQLNANIEKVQREAKEVAKAKAHRV